MYNDLVQSILNLTETSEGINKNDYFILKGQACNKLGVVKKGVFRGFITENNGNETTLKFYIENEIISGNLIPNAPSEMNIQAIENSVIDITNYEYAMSLVKEDSKLYKMYNEKIGQLHSNVHLRLTSFISYNALERYQYFIKEYPNLINRIPNYYIANFLGITPTQLSRIRRKFAVEK